MAKRSFFPTLCSLTAFDYKVFFCSTHFKIAEAEIEEDNEEPNMDVNSISIRDLLYPNEKINKSCSQPGKDFVVVIHNYDEAIIIDVRNFNFCYRMHFK